MRRSASRAQSACAATVAKFEAGAASRSAVSPSSCLYPDTEVEVILDYTRTIAKEVDQKKSSTRKSSLNDTESHGFCLLSSLNYAIRVSCNHASRAMRSTKSRVKRYPTYRV